MNKMLKIKEGKFAGKEITKIHNQNEKFAKVTIKNGMTITIPVVNMIEEKEVTIDGRIYKNVTCADGKERFLILHNDGRIEYCSNKNGKPWGVGRTIKGQSVKMPKWATEEIKNIINK
jgi:hypothetical protein